MFADVTINQEDWLVAAMAERARKIERGEAFPFAGTGTGHHHNVMAGTMYQLGECLSDTVTGEAKLLGNSLAALSKGNHTSVP
jgi:hypothetical protein